MNRKIGKCMRGYGLDILKKLVLLALCCVTVVSLTACRNQKIDEAKGYIDGIVEAYHQMDQANYENTERQERVINKCADLINRSMELLADIYVNLSDDEQEEVTRYFKEKSTGNLMDTFYDVLKNYEQE